MHILQTGLHQQIILTFLGFYEACFYTNILKVEVLHPILEYAHLQSSEKEHLVQEHSC